MFANNNNTTNVNAGVNLLNSNALIQTGDTTFRGTLNVVGTLNVDGQTNISGGTGSIIDHPVTYEQLVTYNGQSQFNDVATFDTTTTFNQPATFNDVIIDNATISGGVTGNVDGTLTGDVQIPSGGSNTVNATNVICTDLTATGTITGNVSGSSTNADTATNANNLALTNFYNGTYRVLLGDIGGGGPTYYETGYDYGGGQHLDYNVTTRTLSAQYIAGNYLINGYTGNTNYQILMAPSNGFYGIGVDNNPSSEFTYNPTTNTMVCKTITGTTFYSSTVTRTPKLTNATDGSGQTLNIHPNSTSITNIGSSTYANTNNQNQDPNDSKVVLRAPLYLPDAADSSWTNVPICMFAYKQITNIDLTGAYNSPYPTATIEIVKLGGMVTLMVTMPNAVVADNADKIAMDLSPYPEIFPSVLLHVPLMVQNNGWHFGHLQILASGAWSIFNSAGQSSFASGYNTQVRSFSTSYMVGTTRWGD